MGHWVTPLEVVHDGGTEFANNSIQDLFADCEVNDIKTLAYSKEENSLVERANKEVMRHLRNILFETNISLVQLSAWVSNMIVQQQTIFDITSQLQEAKDRAHLLKQDPPVTTFEVGTYVLANYHATDGIVRHRGPPNKFLHYLRGPFQVV
jgi:hypothetical protein